MNEQQLSELLCQSLEHEIGGVQVYETALQCVLNAELRTEWQKYLEETGNHVRVLTETCEAIGVDPNHQSAGRTIVHKVGASLVASDEGIPRRPRQRNWSHASAWC